MGKKLSRADPEVVHFAEKNGTINRINSKWLFVIAAIGLCVSVYGYYVEMKKEEDAAYSALCDVNPMYSCTKILNSEYGRLLRLFEIVEVNSVIDVPNTVGGMLYYTVAILGSFLCNRYVVVQSLLLFAATLGVALSAYLAWVMAFKLPGIICIVCLLSYVSNIALFLLISLPMLKGNGRDKAKKRN